MCWQTKNKVQDQYGKHNINRCMSFIACDVFYWVSESGKGVREKRSVESRTYWSISQSFMCHLPSMFLFPFGVNRRSVLGMESGIMLHTWPSHRQHRGLIASVKVDVPPLGLAALLWRWCWATKYLVFAANTFLLTHSASSHIYNYGVLSLRLWRHIDVYITFIVWSIYDR